MRKYIYGHTSFETAYEVDNYPWGFRLKTKVRYWIETSDKSNGGQRFVKCTLNPKTNEWCNPKKSTYYQLGVMYLNEKNHIDYWACGYNLKEELINEFVETHKEHLTDYQIKTIKYLKASNEVMKNVEYKFENVTGLSDEDRKARKEQNEKNERVICNAIINKSKSIEI